jgi:hypothetical protein
VHLSCALHSQKTGGQLQIFKRTQIKLVVLQQPQQCCAHCGSRQTADGLGLFSGRAKLVDSMATIITIS